MDAIADSAEKFTFFNIDSHLTVNMISFNSLPTDPLKQVFSFLSVSELGKVASLSKRFKEISESDELWKNLFIQRVGFIPENIQVTKKFCEASPLFRQGISVTVMAKLNPEDHEKNKIVMSFLLSNFKPSDNIETLLSAVMTKLLELKGVKPTPNGIKKYLHCFTALSGYGEDFRSEFKKQLSEVTLKDYVLQYHEIAFHVCPFSELGKKLPFMSPNFLSKCKSIFNRFF